MLYVDRDNDIRIPCLGSFGEVISSQSLWETKVGRIDVLYRTWIYLRKTNDQHLRE